MSLFLGIDVGTSGARASNLIWYSGGLSHQTGMGGL